MTRDREDSFAAFYAAEQARVVRSLCHLVRREDAEDIAQEAFARLHDRWSRVSRYDQPDAWVRRVALNLAITFARREARRSDREYRASLAPRCADAPELPDPRVVEALRSLPPRQQALVVLYYYEDRPLEEGARLLGLSHGAAKVALFRARHRLAELLGEGVVDESN